MSIDLTNGTVASHFTGNDTIWQCKDNDFIVGNAILDFYRKFGGDALCGLTYLGLPQGNEQAVVGHVGVVTQEFERACVTYDPNKVLDNPPGSGNCYLVHTNGDPRNVALQSEVVALQSQLDANTQAQEIAALQAKIAQAQKDLA